MEKHFLGKMAAPFVLVFLLVNGTRSTKPFQKFKIHAGTYILGDIRDEQTNVSKFECCIMCLNSKNFTCGQANYRGSDGTCQLLPLTNTLSTTMSPSWRAIMPLPGCDDDWIQYGSQCYKFVESGESWHNARISCQNLNGTLAVFQTPSTFDYVTQQLLTTSFQRGWVGAIAVGGVREWLNGTALAQTGNLGSIEACVELRRINDGEISYRDQHCGMPYTYLCEKTLS